MDVKKNSISIYLFRKQVCHLSHIYFQLFYHQTTEYYRYDPRTKYLHNHCIHFIRHYDKE